MAKRHVVIKQTQRLVGLGYIMFLFNKKLSKQIFNSFLFGIIYRNSSVRVRFAPSPTGHLHLGGLRTALYNHLFALSRNGTTILRIEDTDQGRKVDGAVQQLVDDLTWCGLNYNEGPIFQSDRLSLYKEHVEQLVESGHAYQCFCTNSRLDILRREALRSGQVPRYDNKCRTLTKEEVIEKMKRNTSSCVRFKLTPCSKPFSDLVYGEINQDVASLEGDPVILKTDGFPTYHLANVVDDHDMRVTHVLRGVEWQASTQKHILMYRAFGWEPPAFAHLPLLLNPDGTKLSKRQGDVDVLHYRNKGVFPLAVVNFVVRAGGGFDIEHWQRDTKCFTIKELAETFDLTKINGSSCKVSLDKLDTSNQLELARRLSDPKEASQLVEELQQIVTNHFADSIHAGSIDASEAHVLKILHWTQKRIHYLHDLVSPSWWFLWVIPQHGDLTCEEKNLLKMLAVHLKKASFQNDELKAILQSCAKESSVKFAAAMKLLRKVLSGLKEGPSVVEMIEILGKETVLQRLEEATNCHRNEHSEEFR